MESGTGVIGILINNVNNFEASRSWNDKRMWTVSKSRLVLLI